MKVELSDPSFLDDLRVYLQRNGCPSERHSQDTVDVRVLRSPDTHLADAQQRAKVFTHVRDWCQDDPGVKANLLA